MPLHCIRNRSASYLTDCTITGIELEKNKVRKVRTNLGSVETETVVNACGPWSAFLSNTVDLKIPVSPVRRQWFVTEKIPEIPSEFPFVIDFSQSLYFHREASGLLSGMSNHNQKIGTDQSIDKEWEIRHIETAVSRLPLLGNSGIK